MAEKSDGYYKAAILLATLGEDVASEVMKNLNPKDLQRLGGKITELSDIPQSDLDEVYKEFTDHAKEAGGITVEGKSYIQKVLNKALGTEQAERIMENLVDSDETGLDSLKWMDARSIASLIKGEHPQTVALILTYLDTTQGSEILPHLPEAMRSDVMVRMATLEDIPPGVMQEIGAAIQSEISQAGSGTGKKVSGVKVVANILNQVDQKSEQAIIASISENNPDLAEQIRKLMFVFDDLTGLDIRGMQELMKDVNKDELTLALRAAKEEIKEKVFASMSSRASQLLKEDMEAKGPVKLTEVEKAQQSILKIAKKLADEGKISIGGKGSGEALV
ncbi:MAG: flagellar motor switch protein FliG [Nitrospiria bacterium]